MHSHLLQSFGRRKNRKLTPRAQQLMLHVLPQIQIKEKTAIWNELFPKPFSEIWLEIGFGGGEHLNLQLEQNKKVAMIGCEPFINGVTNFLTILKEENHSRIRLFNDDIRLLLPLIPSESISKIFILFPDPWPKKRHNKRRLISQNFMNDLARILKPKSELRIASDHQSYVEHILNVLPLCPFFKKIKAPDSADPKMWGLRPVEWPPTRYESKAFNKGSPSAYFRLIKKEENSL